MAAVPVRPLVAKAEGATFAAGLVALRAAAAKDARAACIDGDEGSTMSARVVSEAGKEVKADASCCGRIDAGPGAVLSAVTAIARAGRPSTAAARAAALMIIGAVGARGVLLLTTTRR